MASQYRDALKTVLLLGCYVITSAVLILFNKYLVNKARFPHAMVLTTIHMVSCIVLVNGLYFARPSMLPGMERVRGNYWTVFKWFVPIGALFAVMLYCTNVAYLYCSIAFLQFMKEANVVIIFLFSCIAGLQFMNRQRAVIIVWVVLSSSFAVSGEPRFKWAGFVLQVVAQLSECTRIVLAEMVLTGSGLKLDPLTYTRLVTPFCLVALIIGNAITWSPEIMPALREWWPLIIPNAIIAFGLNVLIALVIQNASGVGFIMTGLVKDIVLVIVSSILFHQPIAGSQWACFVVTLLGVFFWSFMKTCPDHPVIKLYERALLVPQAPPLKSKAEQA